MFSTGCRRVLYPGLLLFGLSLALSKSASNVLLGGLYVTALAGVLSGKEFRGAVVRNLRQPLTVALALFCIVAYAGAFHASIPASSLASADGFAVANKFVGLPLVYIFVSTFLQANYNERTRARKAQSLLIAFLAGLTVLDLLGVLIFLGAAGGAKYALPLAPLGLHHIWFSNLNALGLYTALALLLFARPVASTVTRAALGCFLLLAALCILLSTSRSAWFGIALTAVIMVAVMIKHKKTAFFVMLFSLLFFALIYRFVPLIHDRVDLIVDDLALFSADDTLGSSLGARLRMGKAALQMFAQAPIVGLGTGDYFPALLAWHGAGLVPDYLLEFNQPHNMYLFTLVTNGIVGFTALVYIFYRSLVTAVPTLRAAGGGTVFSFLATATAVHFLVLGFMDSFFNIQVLRLAFAFIMGVCVRSTVNGVRRPEHRRPAPDGSAPLSPFRLREDPAARRESRNCLPELPID